MKIYVVLALALVALLTVARAESDIESTTKEGAMKSLKELKDFFSNDPMGQKLAAICKDLKEFFLLAQTKTHSAFKDYVKRLMAEES